VQNINGKILAASCGLVLIGGCTFLRPADTPSKLAISPVSKVYGTPGGNASYELARSHQARMQYEAAIAAYRKSLAENPNNAEARNALGVVYASLGRYEEALTELKAALALEASAAHIHNNLGYAYLLSGRNAEAAAALEVARGLDTGNERVRANLKAAEQRLAQDAPKAAERSKAVAVEPDVKRPNVDSDRTPSMPTLVTVAPNVFELRQGSPEQVSAPAPVVPVVPFAPVASPRAKLEIANGSGATGLARRTSSSLQQRGYAVARVTNQVPYAQAVTEIQFRPGAEDQASELNALFALPARLVQSKRLSHGIGIRILLGRDTGREVALNDTSRNAVAAVTTGHGLSSNTAVALIRASGPRP
jgi:tetratricopeptide (TPR) repeat protein